MGCTAAHGEQRLCQSCGPGLFSGVFLKMDDLKKGICNSGHEKAVPTGTNDYDSTADFQSKAVIFYIWPE